MEATRFVILPAKPVPGEQQNARAHVCSGIAKDWWLPFDFFVGLQTCRIAIAAGRPMCWNPIRNQWPARYGKRVTHPEMPQNTQSHEEGESATWLRSVVVICLVSMVLLSLWFAPALAFNLGVAVLAIMAAREFYLLDGSGVRNPLYRGAGLLGVGVLVLQMIALPALGLGISIPVVVILILSLAVLTTKGPNPAEFHELLLVVFGVLYAGGMFGQLILIRNARDGREVTAVLILTVLAREVGAYWGGFVFPAGKPVNEGINARKSYRGAAVGVATAVGAAVLVSRYLQADFTILRAAVFGTCVGIACQFGDLSESYMKRVAGRRHSGNLLGPEGGILDYLDAVTFAIVVARLLLFVWGY